MDCLHVTRAVSRDSREATELLFVSPRPLEGRGPAAISSRSGRRLSSFFRRLSSCFRRRRHDAVTTSSSLTMRAASTMVSASS